MTQQELDALPEAGGFFYRDNGNGTITPVMRENFALDQTGLDVMMVTDLHGSSWMLGRHHGQLYKRKLRP